MEGEIEIATKYMEDLESMVVQVQQQDSWSWGADLSESYTVGSTYKLLNRHTTNENNNGVY